jgi:hypothetical protein
VWSLAYITNMSLCCNHVICQQSFPFYLDHTDPIEKLLHKTASSMTSSSALVNPYQAGEASINGATRVVRQTL